LRRIACELRLLRPRHPLSRARATIGAGTAASRRDRGFPSARLRILLTNVGIAQRTGAETMLLDLAIGLQKAGHAPTIWSPLVDPSVAKPAIQAGIPVVTRLGDVAITPEIIHGQHHLETLGALRYFPEARAVFVCTSGYWWHDEPPRHARIHRFVAVDEFC